MSKLQDFVKRNGDRLQAIELCDLAAIDGGMVELPPPYPVPHGPSTPPTFPIPEPTGPLALARVS
jgi:hypothetical protein